MSRFAKFIPMIVAVYTSIIFLDSLRYKFTNAPETQVIFGKLDVWAASLGAPGLFGQTGLFSQYVIGSAELVASTLLLVGLFAPLRRLQAVGAAVGLAVMTGAISFHTLTPLGIDPNNDGGGLFMAACGVWISCLVLLILRRDELGKLLCGLKAAVIAPETA